MFPKSNKARLHTHTHANGSTHAHMQTEVHVHAHMQTEVHVHAHIGSGKSPLPTKIALALHHSEHELSEYIYHPG